MITLNLRAGNSTWRFGAPAWADAAGRQLADHNVRSHVAGKSVIVLLHGYNTVDALPAYRKIESKLAGLYDVVIGVQMPLSQVALGFLPARSRATKAGALLASLLKALPWRVLDLQGHSLGCHVALSALRAGLFCRNVILAAPAVDNDCLSEGAEFHSAAHVARRVAVCYSRRDEVLQKGYTAADALAALFSPSKARLALGYTGPAMQSTLPVNVVGYDCTSWIADHSQYRDENQYYALWRGIVHES
jgi:pimeloyl-ACP methyl ester carboxylesterase